MKTIERLRLSWTTLRTRFLNSDVTNKEVIYEHRYVPGSSQVFNYIPKTFRFDLSFHRIQNDNKRVLGL